MGSRTALICLLLLSFVAGCDRAPAAESLPEWSPGDHRSSDDDKLATRGQAPAQASAGRASGDDVARLVDITWRQQCTNCHGATGRGDGQMGPMVSAPDLTRGDWQARVTDAELAALIKTGKNRMPKFDLPDPVVQGLVARVRSFRGR
jgi:cytochrome c oxidase cbb3-type subunit 3